MKDKRGLFYYPFPLNRKVKMYVQEQEGQICFRLWNQEDPGMWMEHGWVPYEAIRQAASLYKKGGFDPNAAYDIDIATALIREDQQ